VGFAVVAERVPNFIHAKIDALVEIHERLVIPERAPDLFAAHHLARPLGQQR
jgi:hypothetical protein